MKKHKEDLADLISRAVEDPAAVLVGSSEPGFYVLQLRDAYIRFALHDDEGAPGADPQGKIGGISGESGPLSFLWVPGTESGDRLLARLLACEIDQSKFLNIRAEAARSLAATLDQSTGR